MLFVRARTPGEKFPTQSVLAVSNPDFEARGCRGRRSSSWNVALAQFRHFLPNSRNLCYRTVHEPHRIQPGAGGGGQENPCSATWGVNEALQRQFCAKPLNNIEFQFGNPSARLGNPSAGFGNPSGLFGFPSIRLGNPSMARRRSGRALTRPRAYRPCHSLLSSAISTRSVRVPSGSR
jgi:hypothetical protein